MNPHEETNDCYLCGKELSEPITRDHVPPRQIYGKTFRKENTQINLLTLPTHLECNSGFSLDEEYFVNTLAPLGKNTASGKYVLEDIFQKFHKTGKNQRLVQRIRSQFTFQPQGIYCPPNLVAMEIDGEKIHRVAWKILRGLFFFNTSIILPLDKKNKFQNFPPQEIVPEAFIVGLGSQPILGDYHETFSYRYCQIPEVHNMWMWGLCFWESVLLTFVFHSLGCQCKSCLTDDNLNTEKK